MINGLNIYYSNKVSGSGLKPIGNNKQKTISIKGKGLKPISSKGRGCKKVGSGLKILQ